MKRILFIVLALLIFLTSCSKPSETNNYKTDVSTDDIALSVYDTLEIDTLTKADSGWIALNMPIDSNLYEACTVYLSTTGAADHFGIFKADSVENAEKVKKQADKYLVDLEENWMSDYLPEELPKVQNSVCEQFGHYVCFIVVDQSLQDSAVSTIKNMLDL